MPGLFESFRNNIISMISPDASEVAPRGFGTKDTVDNLIALGVLLWVVAQADERFLPQEKEQIAQVLHAYGQVSEEDMPIVMRAIEEASINRIDLYAFTSEVGAGLSFKAKIGILENLFRVACIDGNLAGEEQEAIRKIAGLFHIEHKDFIETKIRVKKEFGMDTAGL